MRPTSSGPIATPLDRCGELLGVDLATVRELAANVEPCLRADGTKVWSLMQLERNFGLGRSVGGGAATSTVDGPGRRHVSAGRDGR